MSGINYIHSLNNIPLDIKPDNFLISSEVKILLTDFDLCLQPSKGKDDPMTRTAVTLYYRVLEIFLEIHIMKIKSIFEV